MKKAIQRVEKPWGHELIWAKTKDYVGKVLFIKKGHQLSLQYHREKEETIFLQSGKMTLLFEEKEEVNRTSTPEGLTKPPEGQDPIKSGAQSVKLTPVQMVSGDVHHIPPNRQHRMIADEDCTVFEVSTPQLDDVVRIEDSYGRTH